jgi:oligopeptidase B
MDQIAPTPPVTRKQPCIIEQLGRTRADDFRWMKDDNWQAVLRDPTRLNPEIRAHLLAENAYTKAVLANTEMLQQTLAREMQARIKQDDASVPMQDGAYAYYRRYEPGAQHPIFARRPHGGGEEILLDADAAAKGLAYYRVAAAAHSPDHRLFAYAADGQGSEVYEIRIKNLETGALLPEMISPSTGNFAFSPCSRFIFWTYRDENSRPAKIFCRRVGWAEDRLVYEEKDEGFYISVEAAASGGSIFINCGNQETSEVWRIPGAEPTATPAVIAPREPGLRYSVEDRGDTLVILTNADGAVDFKIVQAPSAAPGRANWRDVVPHRAGHYITGVLALRDYILHAERAEANDRIVVTRRDGSWFPIAMEEPAYALRLEPGYEYATSNIRYVYSSPTTPAQWFDYDIASGTRVLRKTQEIPSGHDPALYETRRLSAPAPDGAQIPVTVLMRRGTKLDGSAPVHLYGYGSYGISIPAGFSTNILSLVDRGWIHVIAHIRGGTEKGWNWFLDGRGTKKMNSFIDFIAVAEHLIAQGYARPKNIVAHGGSAGGLLMGAVLNLRPDLWAGVIAAVPFVDVLNTMSDTSLPMTPPEWPEWGNPITDPQAYDTIAAYSPYDNISAQDYPAVLATGGLSDPRVTYWEPAKFIAKLRGYTTGQAPLLLHINMQAGHAGAAGRFDALAETARDYAFAMWAVEEK